MSSSDKPYIFFDLDGPILDVSEKYFRVYQHVLEKFNKNSIDKKLFWELKRNREPVDNILDLTNAKTHFMDYKKERNRLIETEEFISYDILQPDCQKILGQLSQKYRLILVTLRGSRLMLEKELTKLDLLSYFESILSSGQHLNPRWKIKFNLIQDYFKGDIPLNAHFIGDTETDILAGKNLNCITVAVDSGIRNQEHLKRVAPDHHVKDIRDLTTILL